MSTQQTSPPTITLVEAANLASSSDVGDRNRSMVALHNELTRLAARGPRAHNMVPVLVPAVLRGELVSDVLASMVNRLGAGPRAWTHGDASVRRYLEQGLAHEWLDRLRASQAESQDDEDQKNFATTTGVELHQEEEDELLLSAFRRVHQLAEATLATTRDPVGMRETWEELLGVYTQRVVRCEPRSPEAAAQDQRFSRFRRRMLVAADGLVAKGTWSLQDLQIAERTLRHYFMQQPKVSDTLRQLVDAARHSQ